MGAPFFKYEIISWHFIGLGMEGGGFICLPRKLLSSTLTPIKTWFLIKQKKNVKHYRTVKWANFASSQSFDSSPKAALIGNKNSQHLYRILSLQRAFIHITSFNPDNNPEWIQQPLH